MPLVEELIRSGHWLFRWRSYLPLALVVVIALSMSQARRVVGAGDGIDPWELLCLSIALLGVLVRALTVGHTPWGTSGRNTRAQVAETLNTTGLYSVVRHPLYVGNFLMGLGVALFPGLWWLALIFVLAFWLYYERIMLAEEAFLLQKFGDAYVAWAAVTPAFVPDPRRYTRPALPFSLRNVIRREYNGVFAVVILMTLLEVVGDWDAEHRLGIDGPWAVLCGAAFVAWVAARTVKRNTGWLDVRGRASR